MIYDFLKIGYKVTAFFANMQEFGIIIAKYSVKLHEYEEFFGT
jgi:hypothetical protein